MAAEHPPGEGAGAPLAPPLPHPLRRRPAARNGLVQLRDLVSTYLPLLLMLALSGATWWLVRITPLPPAVQAHEPSPQTPDYTLQGVDLQRYQADGALMARIQGKVLRHYPLGDRMELDDAHIQAQGADGPLSARARFALVTERGDHLLLQGDVVLARPATQRQPAFEVVGKTVEYDVRSGHARSPDPVQWRQEGTVVDAAGFEYRQSDNQLQLNGPVRARWVAPGTASR